MRQISVHRPHAKVRGIPRRLRELAAWADAFEGFYPDHGEAGYLNWKIPVLDRMVEGRTALPEIRRLCFLEMIRAAEHLIAARPPNVVSRVTVLISCPDWFGTEICIFPEHPYRSNFFERDRVWEKWRSIPDATPMSERLRIDLPVGFDEMGYSTWYAADDDFPERSGEIWAFGEIEPFS